MELNHLLRQIITDLTSTNTKLIETNAELTSTNVKLMETNAELTSTHTKLIETNAELTSTIKELMATIKEKDAKIEALEEKKKEEKKNLLIPKTSSYKTNRVGSTLKLEIKEEPEIKKKLDDVWNNDNLNRESRLSYLVSKCIIWLRKDEDENIDDIHAAVAAQGYTVRSFSQTTKPKMSDKTSIYPDNDWPEQVLIVHHSVNNSTKKKKFADCKIGRYKRTIIDSEFRLYKQWYTKEQAINALSYAAKRLEKLKK